MNIQPTATLEQFRLHAGEWLTVKQLADKLFVHPDTIRRWTNKGRIKCVRHPANNYRLYLISDLWGAKKDYAT